MARIEARNRYWRIHPPTHILVQALAIHLGIESAKPKEDTPPQNQGGLADLAAMFPAGRITVSDLKG